MIDIHAHFADEGYTFPDEWEKIKAAGVNTVVLAGDNLMHSKMHRDFCREYAGAYFCAGVHSENAEEVTEQTLEELAEFCRDEKCIAIGEIGLDYHYPETDRQKQREAFIAQILLAEREGLPVQIHSRDSAADMLAILREMKAHLPHGFLLHCYSHGADMLPLFAALGGSFSFGGVSCFKNARSVWESVQACPMDRILSETDSPYLSPLRGEKNSPSNIPIIVEKLAQLKGVSVEEMQAAIRTNAKRLFPKIK